MSRLDEILSLVKHVPPFPKVAQRVSEMLNDSEVSAAALAEVIQYDQVITANVLKICNAAYFGLSRKVASLDEALVIVGNDTLKDIIVTSSSARFYKGAAGEGYKLDQGELWKHSIAVGIMSKELVNYVKDVEPGSAYTAGLLHDIGKRFLSSFVADDFKKIMMKVVQDNCSFVEAEKELLGASHAELGGMIMSQWDFPKEIELAVLQHHDPDALEKDPLTAIVALANALVISMGIGVGADGLSVRMQGGGLKRFGITPMHLELCMANLLTELDRAQELFHI
ncbi:MAG: HDOD domain-containing protein [Desulfurivibrionaceae bacterium]|jgi:putative nucleotidyltransferase with HDIG domain|nr:HDOD domain-containing protein [Pseudomonadota bacterium]MCG2823610.1 HDOD domain-containing protein [Desulfobulbaceae bacterium]MDP2003369.1 HDOD domain-containing protein [Desulfurivibrionaceae bacterium]PKN15331.1 MAG: phosphohydrolase [Deltaproteobacteria bacterium HGW-Deltaproteobacteria-3]MBU4230435.1 HDOD domain-containing protein [Pseudomonadota bacterium]